ncbi:MAG: hypothetical protein QOE35_920 [Actinomycetota bacterium]|jgi:hypothetical protein
MITTAVVALVASGLVFVLVIKLSSSPDAKNNLGDPTFLLNKATDLAREIDERGPPVFQAPQGGGARDIYVNHLGSDPKTGWIAFDAYRGRRTCQLRWNQRTTQFTDPCTKRSYGPDPGPEFTHYKAMVLADGRLEVDFRATSPATSTTGL